MGTECLYIWAEFEQQTFCSLGKQKRSKLTKQKTRSTIGQIIRTVIVYQKGSVEASSFRVDLAA